MKAKICLMKVCYFLGPEHTKSPDAEGVAREEGAQEKDAQEKEEQEEEAPEA